MDDYSGIGYLIQELFSLEKSKALIQGLFSLENSKPWEYLLNRYAWLIYHYVNSDVKYLIEELIFLKDKAWDYFLKRYGRLIYYYINKTIDRCGYQALQDEREDIFQVVMTALLAHNRKGLKSIQSCEEQSFRSWLRTVTIRRTLNFFRGVRPLLFPDNIDALADEISPSIKEDDLYRQLEEIIQKLDSQESLVMLYILDGLTLQEIAGIMGISIASVYRIKKQAIQKIREYLKGDEKILK